jgi:hypothetical protein
VIFRKMHRPFSAKCFFLRDPFSVTACIHCFYYSVFFFITKLPSYALAGFDLTPHIF